MNILTILLAIGRGALKALIPPLVPIIEAGTNAKVASDNADKKEVSTDPVIVPQPHSWVSIVTQLLVWICILYAFWTKAIPLKEVIDYLKG